MGTTDEVSFGWKLPIPWTLAEIKPELHVYSTQLGRSGQTRILIKFDDDIPTAVERLWRNALLDTISLILVTHGFQNTVASPWLPEMKNKILEVTPDATVILVNWGGGAHIGILKYTQAAANTQTVAAWLAEYLQQIRNFQPSLSMRIWGIAHSLGAHLLGLTGRQSKLFDRITGLDPAGPGFEKVNQENRLCATDADLVDVIHTDGYDCAFDPEDWFAPVNHYGTLIPLGRVDFYHNYGYSQPGAERIFTVAGSHHRAIDLFLWSITNPGKLLTNKMLVAKPEFEKPVKEVKTVEDTVEMGYHFARQGSGLFYIPTASKEPWDAHESESAEDRQNSENESPEHASSFSSYCSVV